MYNAIILEHLDNPRNAGAMPDATVRGSATNPVCGDLLHLYLKLANEQIIAASFEAQSCPPCIAAASLLTVMLIAQSITAAQQLKPNDLKQALGGLPRNKEHCAHLALDALRDALAQTA
ncbi:MAG: iron-sulfur cluster assembly scaffold protein [Acidobacteria bacterium]|nr:iron-sulfur cluster assembly scaffold protein [Acidobacteriota bacterium]